MSFHGRGNSTALSLPLNRRDALKLGVLSSAALLLPFERRALTKHGFPANRIASGKLPKPYTRPFAVPPVLQPVKQDATTDYYQVWQTQSPVEIIPGLQTPIFGYNGITPGPTIHVAQRGRRGRRPPVQPAARDAPAAALHRLDVDPPARLRVAAAVRRLRRRPHRARVQFKDYHYPNFQDARTLWYHDHGVHHTAQNVYMGLAALYLIHDELERRSASRTGDYDVPLVVTRRDVRRRTAAGLRRQRASPACTATSSWSTACRGRSCGSSGASTGSASSTRRSRARYRLQLSTGDPFDVIGTDGGLMPAPQQAGDFRHGMAERYEVVIDFSKYQIGQRVELHEPSPQEQPRLRRTPTRSWRSTSSATATDTRRTTDPGGPQPETARSWASTGAVRPRRRASCAFEREDDERTWTINGTDLGGRDQERLPAGASPTRSSTTSRSGSSTNKSGGWFHPVHIHLVDFKILSRNGAAVAYEQGPKDVVYVGENENGPAWSCASARTSAAGT